jgi:predicted amidophosphoribosyltransferase
MTPERIEYFKKSSNAERDLRMLIKRCKKALKIAKSECSAFNLKPSDKKPLEYLVKYVQLQDSKMLLQALRNELQRLTGMDRVVVPREVTIPSYTDLKQGCCICGRDVYDALDSYCPNCGRRILWDKTL